MVGGGANRKKKIIEKLHEDFRHQAILFYASRQTRIFVCYRTSSAQKGQPPKV
jgi:hypothetical protein